MPIKVLRAQTEARRNALECRASNAHYEGGNLDARIKCATMDLNVIHGRY